MTTRSPKVNTRSTAKTAQGATGTGSATKAASSNQKVPPTQTTHDAQAMPTAQTATAAQAEAAVESIVPSGILNDIIEGLSMLKTSIDKIDSDNKRNGTDMIELRNQIAALQTNAALSSGVHPIAAQSIVVPPNVVQSNTAINDDLRMPHVTFATIPPHQPTLETTFSMPPTPSAAIEQPLGENANSLPAHMPMHSTPYSRVSHRHNSIYVEDMNTKLYPLPLFSGKPEDWPLFKVSFDDTTQEFGYNNRQNLMRLQKAVQGAAKEVVASLLLYADNVPQIMEELCFNFGRPEILVRSQLQQLQQIAAIAENNTDGIIHLSNKVRNIVALFKASDCQQQLLNPMLLEQLLNKLPRSKQFEWAKHAATIESYVTLEHFSNWVSELAKVICFMPVVPTMCQGVVSAKASQPYSTAKRLLHTSYVKGCRICKGEHVIHDCDMFKALEVNKKWDHVKKHRLCISCLKFGHQLVNCHAKRTCDVNGCKRMHNQLLHEHRADPSGSQTADKVNRVFNLHSNEGSQLFRILPVLLKGPSGSQTVYAMFDEGSSITLLEDCIARQLGLQGQSSPLSLQWYNDHVKTESSRRVTSEIAGLPQGSPTYVIKNIRTVKKLSLPQQTFIKENFDHLKALPIANYENAVPVLLIGLDNCHLGLAGTYIDSDAELPVAAKTKLGWVAYGPNGENPQPCVRVCHVREVQPMKKMLALMENYLSIENDGVNAYAAMESDEDIRATKILKETTKRLSERYETGLLWRENNVAMPHSFDMAKNRLIKVEKQMNKNAAFANKYCQEMQKYIDKNYARALTDEEIVLNEGKQWYLPHFGVVNPNKPDKLRIVFDAAAIAMNVSLNSHLMKGPQQAKPMLSILMKFREGVVGVAGDIQEMFSQVKIIAADQHAQRFLWRNGKADEPIKHYAMTSMIFGATCSPCCAEYVKNANANNFSSTMPAGADAVINNMYVDDLVISFDDLKTAHQVISETVAINAEAGFNLRNIVSNSVQLEQYFNTSNANEVWYDMSHTPGHAKQSERVLGLFWNKAEDTFGFRFQFHKIRREVLNNEREPTKRELLGILMAIFDPIGFLANITVTPKILIQESWKSNIPWDSCLPKEICRKWRSWWNEFKNVQNFSVPRCYTPLLHNSEDVQLHVFVDASTDAYAAVAYLRVSNNDHFETAFVSAKSRIAPTKTTTIPRLELQAAVLGVRLKQSLVTAHNIKISSTTFWSDSKTVILWIRSTKRDYKQFVGARVAEVLSHSEANDWHWLPTSLNVADEATRPGGKINSRWLNGPQFLRQPKSDWPKEDTLFMSFPNEDSHAELLLINERQVVTLINYAKFSSFYDLQKHVAWILRFIANAKGSSLNSRILSSAELENAKKRICALVQNESFANDLQLIAKGKELPKSSALYHLTPFMDNDGLIKARGRIDKASCLPNIFRRPIIMPNSHHVTHLIMREYHEKMHHQNNDLTVNEMRQQYWVPRIKTLLKNVQRCCSTCVKERARPEMPLMGSLPEDRLTPYLRPFTYVGVDYCGPFNIAIGRRREKRWVALFTCLNTRAIHLEVAADLSTDGFLLCWRNFINRRGTPVRVRSDNGTNFIKAEKEIRDVKTRLLDVDEIQKTMAKNNIEWIFNCPSNPHAGGCWERLIKIVKRLLYRILNSEAPQLHTFNSVLIEIENIVNSRPLTDLPINAEDEEPITPNHFLLGCVNSTQTPALEESPCMRKQWKIAQNLKDRLWKRWTLEYLPQLLVRPKWCNEVTPIAEGQLVLIIDNTLPRSQWKMGKVLKVIKAADGQVRSAEVKTSNGCLKRPAAKLAVLKFSESFTATQDSRGEEM